MKRFICLFLSVLMLSIIFVVPVSAESAEDSVFIAVADKDYTYNVSGIQPRLNKTVEVALNTSSWTDVAIWSPLFNVHLVCINNSGNANAITFRVVNFNSDVIGSEKACNPGGQVEYDIPSSLSGWPDYHIQAKANWSAEVCSITVADGWP